MEQEPAEFDPDVRPVGGHTHPHLLARYGDMQRPRALVRPDAYVFDRSAENDASRDAPEHETLADRRQRLSAVGGDRFDLASTAHEEVSPTEVTPWPGELEASAATLPTTPTPTAGPPPPPPPPPPPAPVTAAVTATAASEPATEPASEPSVELPAPPPVPTAELPAPPPLPSIELPAPPPLPTVELPAPPPILTGRTEVAPAAEAGPESDIDIASLESEEGTGWNAVEQVEAVWTAEARAQIGPDPGPVDGAPVAFDATSFDEMAALRAVMVLERAADRIEHLAGDRASAAWAATHGLDGELKAQFEAACERHQDALARSVGELRSLAARLVRATVEATELELSR